MALNDDGYVFHYWCLLGQTEFSYFSLKKSYCTSLNYDYISVCLISYMCLYDAAILCNLFCRNVSRKMNFLFQICRHTEIDLQIKYFHSTNNKSSDWISKLCEWKVFFLLQHFDLCHPIIVTLNFSFICALFSLLFFSVSVRFRYQFNSKNQFLISFFCIERHALTYTSISNYFFFGFFSHFMPAKWTSVAVYSNLLESKSCRR